MATAEEDLDDRILAILRRAAHGVMAMRDLARDLDAKQQATMRELDAGLRRLKTRGKVHVRLGLIYLTERN